MSQVKLTRRKESSMQFVDTARELFCHTLQYCRKFPKSAMFLLTKDIVDIAREIYKDVLRANSIYPASHTDLEIRYKLLMIAKANVRTLDALLGIAKDSLNINISDFGWLHWGELMDKEEKLIKGVIASDKKREL